MKKNRTLPLAIATIALVAPAITVAAVFGFDATVSQRSVGQVVAVLLSTIAGYVGGLAAASLLRGARGDVAELVEVLMQAANQAKKANSSQAERKEVVSGRHTGVGRGPQPQPG